MLMLLLFIDLWMLDDYIKYYDELDYDIGSFYSSYMRIKWILGIMLLEFKFKVFNRCVYF